MRFVPLSPLQPCVLFPSNWVSISSFLFRFKNGLQNLLPPGSVPRPSCVSPAPLESPVPPGTAWPPGGTLDLVHGISPFSLSFGFAIPAQRGQTLGCLFTVVPEPDP